MKYFTLLSFFAVCCTSADCQYREKLKKDKFNSAKFKDYEVEINKKRFDNMEFVYPVEYSFIDARADKSKLGFIRAGDGNDFLNMVFPKEANEYINSRVSGASKASVSDPKKLLIVIRHFWLCQVMVKAEAVKRMLLDSKGYLSYCYFSGDFYLENNGQVQYLGKIDTVHHFHRWMGNVANDLVNNTLEAAMDVGDSLAAHAKPTASFSSQQWKDSLLDQFNYQILKAGSPRRGIYMKYEDFLNDQPLDDEFELKEYKRKEYLQAKKTDTSLTNKAWGYSDGKNVFKHLNEDYYMMIRVQNTFEVAGPRIITRLYTDNEEFFSVGVAIFFRGVFGGISTIVSMWLDDTIMKELVPYQLNIRNGTFY